jgi:hypothetical protein
MYKMKLKRSMKHIHIVTAMFLLCAFIGGSATAEAGCRWEWRGMNSVWVCDDDNRGPRPAKLCGVDQKVGRNGQHYTVSTYCRPDGSPWKEVTVRPRSVVVKLFSRDGRLLDREKIETAGYDHPSYRAKKRRHRHRIADISGGYDANIPGGKMFVNIQQRRKELGLRADVYNFLGQKDTYHFKGRLDGDRINATHTSGHKFTGVVKSADTIDGVISMRDGRRIGMTLHKR